MTDRKQSPDSSERISLYVDDWRPAPAGFAVARSYEEAVLFLESTTFDVLSLDFDLGFDAYGRRARNGIDLVEYICSHSITVREIRLHSSSMFARMEMYDRLMDAVNRGQLEAVIRKDV